MVQATSCPSVPDLQRLLLGHSADEESVSLEEHLLHCEKCLRTMQTLSPDDALISALQQGCESATPAPSSGLLDKVRRQLLEMRPPSSGMNQPNTGETVGAAPSPMDATQDVSMPLAPPRSPDEIGWLGGYRILKELGRGGMGVVYQAEDSKLKRLVALKVMAPSLAADAASRQRFLREAVAMAAVHHDNIVTIFQVDEANGVPFLAMEFLQGMPLDQWLKGGRKATTAQVLRMGREIAEGLAAAHERGLIHRDVKPGNIWLDSDHKGRIKILDFGLARVGADDVHLTRSGAIVGTPAYMSPEQARGEKVDGRTDLFSFGCVLYRLCTGAMPFAGDTTMGLLMSLALDQPKSARELNPDLPVALFDLVTRLLEKEPAKRPQSAREVVELIEAIEKDLNFLSEAKSKGLGQTELMPPNPSAIASIPPKRRRTAVVALLAGAAAVVLAMAGAVVYVQTDRGTLEINTLDPDVKVLVEQGGAKVDILDSKSKQQLSIHSGKYTLKLIGADDAALELTTDQGAGPVTLTRGGKVVVTVRRVDKPAEAKAKSAFPPLDEAWVQKVRDLPLKKQVEEVAAELKRRNPDFDGKISPSLTGDDDVEGLSFSADNVTDISPVKVWPGLRTFTCTGSGGVIGLLSDLSPLKGMPLSDLNISGTRVSDLSPLKDMKLRLLICNYTRVSDLSPLHGMPLKSMMFGFTRVSDLSPVKGMPLEYLMVGGKVSDLSPLKGTPLKDIACDFKPERDADILRSIKTLETINGKPVAEFWKDGDGKPYPSLDDAWLKQVAAMPANRQVVAVVAELMARNPGFDGKVTPNVQNGVVTGLLFLTDDVTDISPVRALVGLRTLHCSAAYQGKGRLADLSPLKGMELTQLECQGTRVSDLSPLMDIPLVWLACRGTAVKDLSPLKRMPLTLLDCSDTAVKDLSPLKGMPLKNITCDIKPERDAAILRSIKTLETINGKPVAEFWKEVDGKPYPSLDDAWIKEVAGLFPKQQIEAVRAELKKRNPGFDGHLDYKTKDGVVVEVRLAADHVADISPLRALTGVQVLYCGSIESASPLADLSPLKGMKLTELVFPHTQVSDLSPLKGMPLTSLACSGARVADLSPLKGAPLTSLDMDDNRAVSDLTPLHGAPLTTLLISNTSVEDLSPLKGMALTQLSFHGTGVSDVTPLAGMPLTALVFGGSALDLSWLKGMPLTSLDCNRSNVSDLSPLKGMKLTTLICFGTQVSDLSPLKGMPLTSLYCANTKLSDLTPLRGMPLTALNIPNTPVSDLSPLTGMKLELLDVDHTPVSDLLPLKGMPLRQLQFSATKVSDLSPLRDMPLQFLVCDCKAGRDAEVLHSIKTLQTINFKPTAEFLKEVDAKSFPPLDEAWVQKVADLSLEKQVEEVAVELKRRNPGFDGKMESFFEHNAVKALTLKTDDVADLTPLRAFPRLKWLGVYGIDRAKCRLADLTPLMGMQLTRLDLQDMVLSDLAPLKGMPLTYLKCNNTRVSDLSPLKDMKLTELNCNNTRVSDLSPLKDMKLTTLRCGATQVADLSALHGMPLTSLECGKLPISDLLPLKDMKLTYLNFADTAITDLSPLKGMPLTYLEAQGTPPIISLLPLKGMPLTYLNATIQPKRDAEILRSIKTLQTINGKSAAEFLKEVDAKPFPPLDEAWVKKVRELPAEKQVEEVTAELMRRNPGFDGKATPQIDSGTVAVLQFLTDDVADVSPVRALLGLRSLICSANGDNGSLADLSPLKEMPLNSLNCTNTKVSDLLPLKGMPLRELNFNGTRVSDLSPLKGMQLQYIGCGTANVSDLSPLKGMPLLGIWIDFKPERDAEFLRSFKTLLTINGKPAAEFWKGVDAKATEKKP